MHAIIVENTNKARYFDTLFDLQFSPYVPIQLIPVGVERSNGTPTGTSRLLRNQPPVRHYPRCTCIISLMSSWCVPVAPVSRQYSSTNPGPGSASSYPQVAVAEMARPLAKLNVGGVNSCPHVIKINENSIKITKAGLIVPSAIVANFWKVQ